MNQQQQQLPLHQNRATCRATDQTKEQNPNPPAAVASASPGSAMTQSGGHPCACLWS